MPPQQLLRQQQEEERILRDDPEETTIAPTGPSTTAVFGNSTQPPAADETPGGAAGSKGASRGFGFFTLALFLLVVAFILWRLWVHYQYRQEQRRRDYQTVQAGRILGEMQMVPRHGDDDLDNELI